ncbi:head-tail connector protein [Sphingomonas sp. DC2300-3]|uniref:head-tail connector protein n=1 Tax=unclassified Sphingomonas TaxID=196159 RepID=UPI003CE8B522
MAIPVTLEDARRQVKLEADDVSRDDDLIGWIADAAAWVEDYTGRLLSTEEVTEQVRVPGRAIELRAWPIAAGAALTVTGPGGTPVAGARLDTSRRPARIYPPVGTVWPLSCTDESLTVTITAGYPDVASVPGNIRRAMLLLIGAYDADREGGEIFAKAEEAARRLCGSLRLRRV